MDNNETNKVTTNMNVKDLLEAARAKEDVNTDPAEIAKAEEEAHIVGQDWANALVGKERQSYTTQPTEQFAVKHEEKEYEPVSSPKTAPAEELKEDNPSKIETQEETNTEPETQENTTPIKKISRETIQYANQGLILNNDEIKGEEKVPAIGDIGPKLQDRVDKYMDNMDKEIDQLKTFKDSILEALKEKGVDISDKYKIKAARIELLKAGVNISNPEAIKTSKVDLTKLDTSYMNEDNYEDKSVENSYQKYNEVSIIIDKIGMGKAIEFDPEEKEKLRKANVIKLKEIEEISLEHVRIKRAKKETPIKDIIKKGRNPFTTNIVAVASGYTCVMRGGSSYEIIALLKEAANSVVDTESKWQLIYDKIDSMSCGKPDDFNDWLKMTAAADYNTFLYGILVATYPDDDTITFTCNTEDCKKAKFEFDYKYSVRSLLRVERMDEKMQQRVKATIDNSMSSSMSKAFIETSAPISETKRIRLPYSEMIVELQIQSAYDLIYRSIKELGEENANSKYAELAVLSTSVAKLLIPDMEEGIDEYGNYEYYELTQPSEIVEALYTLQDKDLVILNKVSEDLYDDINFEFGLMNVTCPRCHKVTPFHAMEVENILFRKLQQAAALEIE